MYRYHHHSYRSVDCETKLDRKVYADSSVAKGIACGRMKAKALCENILASFSSKCHIDCIKQKDLTFSLAIDASNKGAIKCIPVVLQYFNFDKGVQHVLLDFFFYLPYLSSIYEKANCITMFWTVCPHSLGNC